MSCQVLGYDPFCNNSKHLCHVKYLAMRLSVTTVNICVMSCLGYEAFCNKSKHLCHVKYLVTLLERSTNDSSWHVLEVLSMITLTLSRLVASNMYTATLSCINVMPFSQRHKAQVGIVKIMQRHSRYMYSAYLALEASGVHHSDGSTRRQRQRAPLLPVPVAHVTVQ